MILIYILLNIAMNTMYYLLFYFCYDPLAIKAADTSSFVYRSVTVTQDT